jgi:hypothetical protein
MDIVIGIADRFIAVRSLLNWVKPFKTPELSRVATPEIERDIRSRAIGASITSLLDNSVQAKDGLYGQLGDAL